MATGWVRVTVLGIKGPGRQIKDRLRGNIRKGKGLRQCLAWSRLEIRKWPGEMGKRSIRRRAEVSAWDVHVEQAAPARQQS